MTLHPVLKWAGGKRWLARHYSWLFPQEYETYLEPFLGGAAIYLALQPKRAILSDLNRELISLYEAIRDREADVERELKIFSNQHSDAYYYKARSELEVDEARAAARFLYLNRTCWNGLYRVNLRGEFNVPRGTKDKVLLPTDNFSGLSKLLSTAKLDACDFSETIDRAGAGDFVFLDPPYTVAHNNNGFLKYNEEIFSWRDQVRLRDSAIKAGSRGAKVLILNACHQSLRDLYLGQGHIHTISRKSVIAGTPSARKGVEELAIQIGYSTSIDVVPVDQLSDLEYVARDCR